MKKILLVKLRKRTKKKEIRSEEEILEAKIKEWEEQSKNKDKTQNNNLNIYSKQEISKLRREFISSCVNVIDKDLSIYKKEVLEKCHKIKYVN